MGGQLGRVGSFITLDTGNQMRIATATALLLSMSLVIFVTSFSRVRRRLLWLGDTASMFIDRSPTPARIVWAVDIADRQLPGDRTCLMRSLTAETLLRAHGYAPEHRVGVNKNNDGGVEAHSWLEYNDEILIGNLPNISKFEPLPPLEQSDFL